MRNDYGTRKLRTLHFVDGGRVGQLDIAERIAAAFDLDGPAIKIDCQSRLSDRRSCTMPIAPFMTPSS